MSGAASEQLALLASFAEEIEPLLAMLAGAIDRLVEHPDDATALTIGRAQVQTLEGAASMLDLTGFTALLKLVREALDTLASTGPLTADGRAAASDLAALIVAEGNAMGRGQTAAVAPAAAAALVARLEGAAVPAAPPSKSYSSDEISRWDAVPVASRWDAVPTGSGWDAVPIASPPDDSALVDAIDIDDLLGTLTNGVSPSPPESTVAEPTAAGDEAEVRPTPWPLDPAATHDADVFAASALAYPDAGPLDASAAEAPVASDERAADGAAGPVPAVDQEDLLAGLMSAVDQEDLLAGLTPAVDQEDVAGEVFAATLLQGPAAAEESTSDDAVPWTTVQGPDLTSDEERPTEEAAPESALAVVERAEAAPLAIVEPGEVAPPTLASSFAESAEAFGPVADASPGGAAADADATAAAAASGDEDTWPGLAALPGPLSEPNEPDAAASEALVAASGDAGVVESHETLATASSEPPVVPARVVKPDDTTQQNIQPEAVRSFVADVPSWKEPQAEPAEAVPPLAAASSSAKVPDAGLQELLASLAELTGEPLPADELAELGLATGAVEAVDVAAVDPQALDSAPGAGTPRTETNWAGIDAAALAASVGQEGATIPPLSDRTATAGEGTWQADVAARPVTAAQAAMEVDTDEVEPPAAGLGFEVGPGSWAGETPASETAEETARPQVPAPSEAAAASAARWDAVGDYPLDLLPPVGAPETLSLSAPSAMPTPAALNAYGIADDAPVSAGDAPDGVGAAASSADEPVSAGPWTVAWEGSSPEPSVDAGADAALLEGGPPGEIAPAEGSLVPPGAAEPVPAAAELAETIESVRTAADGLIVGTPTTLEDTALPVEPGAAEVADAQASSGDDGAHDPTASDEAAGAGSSEASEVGPSLEDAEASALVGEAPGEPAEEATPLSSPSPVLDYLGSVEASITSLLETLDADAGPGAATAPTDAATPPDDWSQLAADLASVADFDAQDLVAADDAPWEATPPGEATVAAGPAGADNAEALAVFAVEQGRLVEALAQARAGLEAAPHDDGALMDLAWATHTLRGAASLVGVDSIAEVCGRVEQVADALAADGLPAPPSALSFFATAEEVLHSLIAAPPDAQGLTQALGILDALLKEWRGGSTETASAAPDDAAAAVGGWGDLPPELAAQLDGVDLATLDEATLGQLAALLDAPSAPAAGLEQDTAAAHPAGVERPEPAVLASAAAYEDWALPTDVAAEPFGDATEAGDDSLGLDDAEFEAEVRAVFLAEAEEHLVTINRALIALEASPGDATRLIEVRRAVHTLKSASAAVGLEAVSDFCHVWEDALEAVEEGNDAAAGPDLSLLLECAEALEHYFGHVEDPAAAAVFVSLAARLAAYGGGPREAAPRASLAPSRAPAPPADEDSAAGVPTPAPSLAADEAATPAALEDDRPWLATDVLPEPPTPVAAAPEPPSTVVLRSTGDGEAAASADVLRVPMRRVDGMIDLVGELVVQRSGLVQRLERLGLGIEELAPSLQRLRRLSLDLDDRFGPGADLSTTPLILPPGEPFDSLSPMDTRRAILEGRRGARREDSASAGTAHAADFDELEFDRYGEAYQLARELAELAADLDTTRRELRQLLEDSQLAVLRSARVTGDLHDSLLDARLVPLGQLGPRLQRTVRQAALKSGKEVAYALKGGDTLLDKTLLEAVADPLLHLLRNAVDHGIEAPAERERCAKPAVGTVTIRAWRDGQEVIVQVRDDGAGIDPARVLARARTRGLVSADVPSSAALAHELIFAPGLSTSPKVTDLSGRGMGLDAVRADLARVKGTVTVASTVERGTVFTLRVPALLVVTPALLVVAGGQRLAIPLAQVRRVLQADTSALVEVGGGQVLPFDDTTVPVTALGSLLGWADPSHQADAPSPGPLTLIVVGMGERQVALIVDTILGQQETVVRPPTPPFDVLAGVAGASVQGNGEVLLVLNLVELLGEASGGAPTSTVRAPSRPAGAVRSPSPPAEPPTVLVVDDSLSVRRVVTRTLQRHGWRVREARDGIQALDVVREATPDVLLLDVEMPRMDGYELASILKKQGPTRHIPIVMLTSRGGEKHRRKAFDLGVDAYLVKPYQETELVRVLAQVALAVPQGAA
jgi:chemosensory pili system protein ChpA (sensor histidine kinase/response regulator)